MSEKPLLEMIGIDKTFGRQTVLKNCSLTVQRGETVVLIGPSGSGKSTLLRCVNMLSPADSGDVFFASQHISRGDVPVHKLRQRIGMVFQNYELFSHLTAAENIMLAPMTVLGMNRIDARTLADNLLAKVRINERADHFRTSSPAASSSAWRLPGAGDEARADALRRTLPPSTRR
jgi:polar amino acid transport system ATP-binding protein